jgi:hypothetical protein
VAFVVAKNITIEAKFSHEEEEHFKQAIKTSVSVGYGPFSVGGSYGYGSSKDRFESNFQNGKITIPGMQIIGWISKVTPPSPQVNG